MRGRTAGGAVVALMVLSTLTGCANEQPPPAAEALRPELVVDPMPDGPIRIGVLVPPVEGTGSAFRSMVEGVRVAGYRFELGGAEIEYAVALDDGTTDGAETAMSSLLDSGVVGVVMATQGDHLTQALSVADGAETAVLLPYSTWDGDGVWSLAPSAQAVVGQVESALAEAEAERPYVVVAEGRTLDLDAARTGTLADVSATAGEIVMALESREIDSVVIDGPAAQQAAMVVALQGGLGSRQLPIVLTPEALTPMFGDIVSRNGTTAGWMYSVGTESGDHVAAAESEQGGQAAVFFSALRLAAGDLSCENIYSDDVCAVGVPRADVASHDATVALTRAAEAAGSTDPAEVRTALSGLVLDHENGLVGPVLDFGRSQALSDEDVVVLHASTSDPGVRPLAPDGAAAASVFWFVGDSS
ncbi:hypothetical protein [Cellulomonas sp. RIT-PI-Y]|uniref:hypothetical protein n=1 Tax=Cellulomonas sp. RIT-PI-Y TaxID=3035297 RepID=UPI0021DA3EC1|nr:hypothetical protein [Cellulomonas sp. RIT-PI-Y]